MQIPQITEKKQLEKLLQNFNITNYKHEDLALACETASLTNADFMYFADTHGGLDLGENLEMFKHFTKLIKDIGMVPGLHLHDHSGKAYFNYRNLSSAGFDSTDISLGGLGKGLGGLLGGGAPNGLPGLGGKPSGKKKQFLII